MPAEAEDDQAATRADVAGWQLRARQRLVRHREDLRARIRFAEQARRAAEAAVARLEELRRTGSPEANETDEASSRLG